MLWKELSLQAPPSFQKSSRSLIIIEPAKLNDTNLFNSQHEGFRVVPLDLKDPKRIRQSKSKMTDNSSCKLVSNSNEKALKRLGRLLKRWGKNDIGHESSSLEQALNQKLGSKSSKNIPAVIFKQEGEPSSPDPLLDSSSLDVKETGDINVYEESASEPCHSKNKQNNQDSDFVMFEDEYLMAPAAEPNRDEQMQNSFYLQQPVTALILSNATNKKRKSIGTSFQVADKRTKQDDIHALSELIFTSCSDRDLESTLDQERTLTSSVIRSAINLSHKILPSLYPKLMKHLELVCSKDEYDIHNPQVSLNEAQVETPVEYVSFIGLLLNLLESKSNRSLFQKRRKVDQADDVVEGEKEHVFEKKSPYECCVKEGAELPETAFSTQVLNAMSDITSGIDACILLLLFILGEGRYMENNPGQSRLVCKEETISRIVQYLKCQVSLTVNAFFEHQKVQDEALSNVETRVFSSTSVLKSLSILIGSLCSALNYCCQLTTLGCGIGEELSFSVCLILYCDSYFFNYKLSYLCLDICSNMSIENSLSLKELQGIGTNLLANIFARCFDLRRFIVEEILSIFAMNGTSKSTTFKLSDGKSIQNCSALLFQLVTACCNSPSMTPIVSSIPEELDITDPAIIEVLLESIKKFLHQCKANLESSQKVVEMIMSILTARCSSENAIKTGKKASSTSQEAAYKSILEAILADQLSLLSHLDWPVSNLICYQSSRIFIQYLDDPNKLGEGYLRNVSTDWLGKLGAILRKPNSNQVSSWLEKLERSGLGGSVQAYSSVESLSMIAGLQATLYEYMFSLPAEDNFKAASIKMMISQVASLFLPLFQDQVCTNRQHSMPVVQFLKLFKSVSGTEEIRSQRSSVASEDAYTNHLILQRLQPLWGLHDRIVLSMMKGIDADFVPVRTKSIKSLSELLNNQTVSMDIQSKILLSITRRLADASPAVREASVEAVSKYALSQESLELIHEYCTKIASRIMDVKVSVRKRVIKTFRDIYSNCLMKKLEPLLEDISAKLFLRLRDEETSVQELAFKTLQDIYFSNNSLWDDTTKESKVDLERKLYILIASARANRALVPIFFEFIEKATDKGTTHENDMDKIVRTIMSMIASLSTSTDESDLYTMECGLLLLLEISKIFPYHFVRHISTLHSLFSIESRDSQDSLIFQSSVIIIKNAIEHMEKPDIQLMNSIQDDLQLLLAKGSQSVLKAAVPCLCSIIQNQTLAADKLILISSKCYGMLRKLKGVLGEGRELTSPQLITCYRVLLILCLIAGHYDFEGTRKKTKAAPYSSNLLQDLTGGKDFTRVVYESIKFFAKRLLDCESSQIALTAFSELLISKPSLFVEPETLEIIQLGFSSTNLNIHFELLNMFILFLEQTSKKSGQTIGSEIDHQVDMKVLVGNAESFQEDGIPTSLLQSFLDCILKDIILPDTVISGSAFRVMAIALENGLVHPVKCIPALCAMESHADEAIAKQAYHIHQKLTDKHASFIHTRNMDAIQCVYIYQKAIAKRMQAPVRGFTRDTAFICPLYNLVRQSKSRRNLFLKNLVSFFEYGSKPFTHNGQSQHLEEIEFYQFIGDSLAYLDYKTQEEIYHVIFFINLILSVGGEELKAKLDGYGPEDEPTAEELFRASVYSVMIQLRDFLQKRFGFSFLQCISSTPAPNQTSHTEKAIAVQDASILLWSMKKDSAESILSHFLELADECLGSGDMDYSEQVGLTSTITSSAPATPVAPYRHKAPAATPGSGSVSRRKSKGGKGNSGAKRTNSATPSSKVPKSKKARSSISKKRKNVINDDYDDDDSQSDPGSDFNN